MELMSYVQKNSEIFVPAKKSLVLKHPESSTRASCPRHAAAACGWGCLYHVFAVVTLQLAPEPCHDRRHTISRATRERAPAENHPGDFRKKNPSKTPALARICLPLFGIQKAGYNEGNSNFVHGHDFGCGDVGYQNERIF